MINMQRVAFAVGIFALSAVSAQARMETPKEVDKILAALQEDNCEIVRDAMGEKKLSMQGDNFLVEAKCADGKAYILTFDQNFKITNRKEGAN
jgi:hypothetical protein